MALTRSDATQPTEADAAYPIPEFQRRNGLSKSAYRQMVNRGLRVRRSGKRAWILGKDFLAFLEREDAPATTKR